MKKRKKRKKHEWGYIPNGTERQYALLEGASLGLFGEDSFEVGLDASLSDSQWGYAHRCAVAAHWQMHQLQLDAQADQIVQMSDMQKAWHAVVGLTVTRWFSKVAHKTLSRPDVQNAENPFDCVLSGIVEEQAELQKQLGLMRRHRNLCALNVKKTVSSAWNFHRVAGVRFLFSDIYCDSAALDAAVWARLTAYFERGFPYFDARILPDQTSWSDVWQGELHDANATRF